MRPDRTRRLFCFGFVALGWGAGPALAGPYLDYAEGLAAHPPQGAHYRPDLETMLVSLLNAYRAEKGKAPVAADAAFTDAARAHAADMMLNNFMGHNSSTGMSFQGRMAAFAGDVTKYPSLGENAARETAGKGSLEEKTRALFQQWVESSPHRKNMVNRSFAFVSTGVIEKGGGIWAVQIFFAAPRAKGIFQ
ncbi:MAG: CAP domain-containing protein [Aestuariivirga sp.]|uniref:CAP domain-containing protein n=1 Tax=Aestuariivirga sp. TaxID=2650926 RepID=UPI0025BFAD27|nr:CAP domain-containing protein [Aestuariivirga sp.]MCA3560876.1 CAP domain-containing protein [Aestuariivirga sp.]